MKMTGGAAVIKALELEGVEVVFGYPGATIQPVYDALLYSPVHHVLVRQEQAAVHAANGYARVTGKVGVCMSTSGPGATNLVTGIATAYMDSIPVVAITGQVPTDAIGRDVFQEVDITGATEPFTKYNYLVKNANDIPRIIKEAFYLAGTGRPGPVLIDIPKDVSLEMIDFVQHDRVERRGYKPTLKGNHRQLIRMQQAIHESEKPVICVGGGCITADISDEVVELAEKIGALVTTTLMGIGTFPSDHPQFLGMLGQHGKIGANIAVGKADLLIVLGARMADRVTGKRDSFAKNAKIVHVDIDPAEIGKNIATEIPIVGDLKNIMTDLLKLDLHRAENGWKDNAALWRIKDRGTGGSGEGFDPENVMTALTECLNDKTIIATDVGQHQIWAGRYLGIKKPRTFLTSGGLGTMGYGMGAAIGAKFGKPDSDVILITGDGSFQMSLNEMATIMQEGIDIKIIMLQNGYLGMVRELQQHDGNEYSSVLMHGNPDFTKLADAYGIKSMVIEKGDDLKAGIKRAVESKGSILAIVKIDPLANVIPIAKGAK